MLNKLHYPSFLILFGLIFGLAISHYLSFLWSKWMTILLYMICLIWTFLITIKQRSRLLPIQDLDKLNFFFFFLITIGLLFDSGFIGLLTGHARYFLPLLIVPYFLGRAMCRIDLIQFMRLITYATFIMACLLLLNYWIEIQASTRRWSFFGYNHSPLLIANFLVISLVTFFFQPYVKKKNHWYEVINSLLLIGITCLLVWVSGRGWLLAGLITITCVTILTFRNKVLWYRLFVVWFAAVVSIVFLKLGVGYKLLLTTPEVTFEGLNLLPPRNIFEGLSFLRPPVTGPILGEESCQPLWKGINSVAIRHVLYLEAFEVFKLSPIIGVGPGRIGFYSCNGPGGFPHATLLQAFSELGFIGGLCLLSIATYSGVSLLQYYLASRGKNDEFLAAFAISLFLIYFIGDQIYGNFFMMPGFALMCGFAAMLNSTRKTGDRSNA